MLKIILVIVFSLCAIPQLSAMDAPTHPWALAQQFAKDSLDEDSTTLQHLAIVPDGNRRWAKENKLEACFGHRKGLDIVEIAYKVCKNRGIKHLSLYTFSLENFKRSEAEKAYLFTMLATEFSEALPKLIEERVRVRFVGDRTHFPEQLIDVIPTIEEATAHCEGINLNLLFCYGSRGEIVHSARELAQKVKDGLLAVEDITEESFSESLWTAGTPDPDLVIRTGNTIRTSNYLLYQAAYAEYVFLDEYWPQMTEELLNSCIDRFYTIKRNFGR